eukprot:3238965-Rhodomonas_salina.1
MCGTELAYGAMQCAVLTQGMMHSGRVHELVVAAKPIRGIQPPIRCPGSVVGLSVLRSRMEVVVCGTKLAYGDRLSADMRGTELGPGGAELAYGDRWSGC